MPITPLNLTAAVVLAGAAAPAAAAARPIDPALPHGAIVVPATPPAGRGFDWPDAGVGAGAALLMVAAGSVRSMKKAARRAASR
jgi:hypothetical protein